MDIIKMSQENRQRVINQVTCIICGEGIYECAGYGTEFTCACNRKICRPTAIMICHGCVNRQAARNYPETYINWE